MAYMKLTAFLDRVAIIMVAAALIFMALGWRSDLTLFDSRSYAERLLAENKACEELGGSMVLVSPDSEKPWKCYLPREGKAR